MKPISMFDPNSDREIRGGGWLIPSLLARVAGRSRWSASYRNSIFGFRLFEGLR